MLKRNIKNILIGVLVLGFLGLIYSFLSSKPEIVSDASMRLKEPALPRLEPAKNSTELGAQSSLPVVGSTELLPADLPEGRVVVDAESNQAQVIYSDIAEVIDEVAETATGDESESDVSHNTVIAEEAVEDGIGSAPMLAVGSDVEVLPEQTGFLDLNLAETTSTDLKLIEGDDLILDDINEDLSRYQGIVASIATRPEAVLQDSKPPTGQSDQQTRSQDEAETAMIDTPVVITIPESDELLMAGNDTLSQEYREIYAKLKRVSAELSEADNKNRTLKSRFAAAAQKNRDRVEKINEINQKIMELTAQN